MRKLLFALLLLTGCQSVPEKQPLAPCPPLAAPFTIHHPQWAETASLYQLNVRQYTPEGTFRAVEPHLARLQKMGVGIIWLMPVQPIGAMKRKGTLGSQYSVRDYRAVNPEFGTLADLKHLIDAAHKLGMHVILDWVANHTSWDNALAAKHPDWYTHGPDGQFGPPVADWQDVIDLNYDNPNLRRYMTESMVYWVKDVGFDGFRADVAGMVPTDFWDATRAELERVKPVFMLAEWDELHSPPFLPKGMFTPHTHLLEKAFDATYSLRLHYLLDSIGRGQKTTATLPAYFAAERRMYPAGVQFMNFTSSHDVNTWDGTEYQRYGPNAQPMAVLTALLPGVPMVYSGQEAAQKKRLRFFDKDTIDWGSYPLNDFYTKLLQLHKTQSALRNYDACASFRLLPAPLGAVAFLRQRGTAWVFTAVNLTDAEQAVLLPAPVHPYTDVFSPKTVEFVGHNHIYLKPHSWRVLAAE